MGGLTSSVVILDSPSSAVMVGSPWDEEDCDVVTEGVGGEHKRNVPQWKGERMVDSGPLHRFQVERERERERARAMCLCGGGLHVYIKNMTQEKKP